MKGYGIKWLYGNEINKSLTKEVQLKLNRYFPKDYINCVLKNDGGYPIPGAFNVNGKMEIFNNLFTLDLNKPCNILSVYKDLKNKMPQDIVPFARDPFGSMICFDYRRSNIPSICFWRINKKDDEKELEVVCETFSELLSLLYRVEEAMV